MKEVGRFDHDGHHSTVVAKEETARGSEYGEEDIEEEPHVVCCSQQYMKTIHDEIKLKVQKLDEA
jgi:hypothetical protein